MFLPALRSPQTPRMQPAEDEQLEAPDCGAHSASAREQEARSDAAGHVVLPAALGAALETPLSMITLEEWHKTHLEQPGQHAAYKSLMLSCEARFRKLERLSLHLRPPNIVVTAVVCDLIYRVFDTLPDFLRSLCYRIMKIVEGAIYSDEPLSGMDLVQLTEALGHTSGRVPYFVVVKRQQGTLERIEERATELRHRVEEHLWRRRNVFDFIIRLQQEERRFLQQWLFQFWSVTYQLRRQRIEKMATAVLTTPDDIVTPFMSWRLLASQIRLDKARAACAAVDGEASTVANRITDMEIENHALQKQLHESLQASAALKAKCLEEQQELARLQSIWDATQPELLLSTLTQSFEFFVDIIMREARISGLKLRHRLKSMPVTGLLKDLPSDPEALEEVPAQTILVRWVNDAIGRVREAASPSSGTADEPRHEHFEKLAQIPTVTNLEEDLQDGAVLCVLHAALRAARDSGEVRLDDLWVLGVDDAETRAGHVCNLLWPFAPTARARCLLSPLDVLTANSEGTSVFLASLFLQEPILYSAQAPGAADESEVSEQLEALIVKMETFAGLAASDQLEDPRPLLLGGEDFQALATTSMESLLLRWMNVQLRGVNYRPVGNFSSDLQDGVALWLLLRTVAPEVMPEDIPEDLDERLDEVTAGAARCIEIELLTEKAILEGQSDLLASFLAQLFLLRRNLAANPNSLLARHLQLMKKICREGLETLDKPGDHAQAMKLCMSLEAQWPKFALAAQSIREANTTIKMMCCRMRTFLGETLAARALGQPKTMLDVKEAKDFILYTSLNRERLVALLSAQVFEFNTIRRIEDLLRKHFRLLRDIFRHYSSSAGSATSGVTLEGLLKLYQECKLRSRELTPSAVEMLYSEHVDETSSSEKSLTPPSFVEVMIQWASVRFKAQHGSLCEQVTTLIESHLKPYACQDPESIFHRMAYEPKVRQALEKHGKELKLVFQLYSTLDTSTTEAALRVRTMNIKEFEMLLQHCELLDATLTEAAVRSVFEGIQQSATCDGEDATNPAVANIDQDQAGLDDDDELAFSEFLDGLVAITAFKFPDPFVCFSARVNSFVLHTFAALRRYWSRKRISPQVNVMLNALQKKLR